MTIEELTKCLILLKEQARNSGANTFVWDITIDSFNYVIDMAIKALEQDSVLDKIRAEIEGNMESIIGKYDSSIPKFNMPSYKIERNKAREECISIIDKYKAEGEVKK